MSSRMKTVVALMVLGAGTLAAQGRLTGIVRDSAGAPIPGAEVTVEGVSRKATTGRRGEFEITGIKAGPVAVLVRRLGYAPFASATTIADGDNAFDVVLAIVPRELEAVLTRDQQLLRDYPLLAEMEENRKKGLGQFVTRTDLAKLQGGFITQPFNSMRGLVVVRGGQVGSHTWLANKYLPKAGDCWELEDRLPGESVTPPNADCNYCYPDIYLDYTRISSGKTAANISQFSPDQLEGIQVFLGAAETPMRYSSGNSSCGVVVFHSRVPEAKPRRIAAGVQGSTRSRISGNVSFAGGKSGAGCEDCGTGTSIDGMVGYTLKDRVVIGARHARFRGSRGGTQTITITQAMVEWYGNPDPGHYKPFANAGLGAMTVSLNTSHGADWNDTYTGRGIPAMMLGTGVDIALKKRFVITPFVSHSRTIGGKSEMLRCVNKVATNGSVVTNCFGVPSQPRVYNLTQLGTRFGWR